MLRIDAHHHLWTYSPEEYSWIGTGMEPLQRDFTMPDLRPLLHASGVAGTVVVQARQTIEETRWLLSQADTFPEILGVVGWLPLADPGIGDLVETIGAHPRLKGIRHIVQAEPPGFLDQPAFRRGLRALASQRLPYDLLLFPPQLAEATRLVDAHPNQVFVLDHLGKPPIRDGQLTVWARDLKELAQRSHVVCKLSGMVTEADPHRWSGEQLQPYVEVAFEAFGPDRLLAGTDWPVLTLGCGYAAWWTLLEGWAAPLSEAERSAILGENARRIYSLDTSGVC